MNHRYRSAAVVPDGTAEPAFDRDPELYYQATTWPGARLPHAWLERDGKQISTLDLCGHGRFTVLTGIGGEIWVEGARAVAAEHGLPLEAFVIGPGRDATDLFGDWAALRGTAEDGCVLVRPDHHVAFRAADASGDVAERLEAALLGVLGRSREPSRL